MSVTIKGDKKSVQKYCKTEVTKVWENIRYAKNQNVHIEIICLVIPTVNNNEVFYKEVAENLLTINENIPLHFTRFYPDYQFTQVEPTPIEDLEKAHSIAKKVGLKFVYLGNVYGHPLENTYCPQCNTLLIKRTGYSISFPVDLQHRNCPNCGEKIPITL
jgi:pyruvate formate lyase activating enzyme